MNFFLHIELPKSLIGITYHDLNMLFGSCFAENIGNKFIEHQFQADVNPFGILYNPESIALSVKQLLENKPIGREEIFFYDGLYHSFAHHSSFSDISPEACFRKMNGRFSFSSCNIRKINRMYVTFGTAYLYRLKETGQVVANCHKLPAKLFVREQLSVAQIVDRWEELLTGLFALNKGLVLFLSVSPVRYLQDGVHENQLSKSILLLAIEELQKRFPDEIVYFPAYELLLDELRDYRFYAGDLLHPSDTALQYIWERFVDTYMNDATRQLMQEATRIRKSLNHRPLYRYSESYKEFISQILIKIERLNAKMPYICFKKEMEELIQERD
ncbi:MAG: GSCFA domain-containing protein [Tannerella sp.]|nr:GSCFA domain-containing protein [Tannerella sp.]